MNSEIVFWAAALLLAYTFAGYPLLIRAWSALRSRGRDARAESAAGTLPAVSILVVAHNEAARIRDKIENLLALDYPRERLEIVIASDGSTDRTADIAEGYREAGVKVEVFRRNRGKPAVLNELVPRLRGDIVVLMDVRQRIEPAALRALVANFSDPRVGAVSGELMLEDTDSEVGEGVGFYWRYEKFIRLHEGRVDSTVGATGALYALRRPLYRPIPENTLIDDVLIPMQIVRQGYRVLFEPKARAHDRAAFSAEEEFTRKVRTIAGNFQLLVHAYWLLNPLANRLWLQTLSHKFFRLLGPPCLAAAFAANLALLESGGLYRLSLALQVFFYSVAVAGIVIRDPRKKNVLMKVASAFCLLNWATVIGFARLATGRQRVTWQKAGSEKQTRPG